MLTYEQHPDPWVVDQIDWGAPRLEAQGTYDTIVLRSWMAGTSWGWSLSLRMAALPYLLWCRTLKHLTRWRDRARHSSANCLKSSEGVAQWGARPRDHSCPTTLNYWRDHLGNHLHFTCPLFWKDVSRKVDIVSWSYPISYLEAFSEVYARELTSRRLL